jgi:hypothetical protein
MKNLTTQLTVISKETTNKKVDFLMKTMIEMMDRMSNKKAFIEHIKSPLEEVKKKDKEINVLVNGIFGYYIYLYNKKPDNAVDLFLNDSMHDLRCFLKNSKNKLKTKNHKVYLKYNQ